MLSVTWQLTRDPILRIFYDRGEILLTGATMYYPYKLSRSRNNRQRLPSNTRRRRLRGIVRSTRSPKQRRNCPAVSFLLFSVSFRRKTRWRWRYPGIIGTRVYTSAFLITRFHLFRCLPFFFADRKMCVPIYVYRYTCVRACVRAFRGR